MLQKNINKLLKLKKYVNVCIAKIKNFNFFNRFYNNRV